jgi:hypothetical protein
VAEGAKHPPPPNPAGRQFVDEMKEVAPGMVVGKVRRQCQTARHYTNGIYDTAAAACVFDDLIGTFHT